MHVEMENNTITSSSSSASCTEPISLGNPELYEFITTGVLLNVVGVLGVLGNVVSMIILSRPQMRSSVNYVLTWLARCDTVLIVTSVLLFGLPSVHTYTGWLSTYTDRVYPHIVLVVYPVALTAQTVSVYLTLTVTLERYVAVCHPLRARSLCTYGRARVYVMVIVVCALLYNLPRCWEARVVLAYSPEHNATVYAVLPTAMRNNRVYVSVYIHWMYLLFLYFIPFSCIAVFNAAIYRQVRRANKERQRLSRLQRREIGLATMLLCVVVVFFLCNVLALVNNVIEVTHCVSVDQLVKTSNLLITINSSVNFVIYVTFGEKFKRLFLRLFCSGRLWPGVGAGAGPGAAGRESPDGVTHDDSVVSNGHARNYSVRSAHAHRIAAPNAADAAKSPPPGPCVYYPSRGEAVALNRLCQPD